MIHKSNRLRILLRVVVLAVVGAATSACCFDGHFGRYWGPRCYYFTPVRHCR